MKLVSALMLISTLFISIQPSSVDAAANKQISTRISHAKELIGSNYKLSSVHSTEKADNISEFVNVSIKNLLPKSQKKLSREIASTILHESEHYGFDPIFLMALIQNESSFNSKLKGAAGEIGLMQIKPSTAEWIARTNKLEYKGEESLYSPKINIRIGAAFMNKLRNQFASKSGLYLSAYNSGAKKVRDLVLEKNAPKVYATAVMKRYFAMYSALATKTGTQTERADIALLNIKNVTAKIARN